MAKLGSKALAGMGGLMSGGGVPRQFRPKPSSASIAGFGLAAGGAKPPPVSPGLRAPGR